MTDRLAGGYEAAVHVMRSVRCTDDDCNKSPIMHFAEALDEAGLLVAERGGSSTAPSDNAPTGPLTGGLHATYWPERTS